MSARIIHYENKYPYLEMARVGILECNLDIFIRTDDPGKLPHFHIVDRNNLDKRDNEGCIRIDKAEYFSHGNKTMTLNSKQRKELIKFLNEKPKNGLTDTNWRYIVALWNDNNSDVILPIDLEMPDYTQLSTEGK